MLKGKGLKENTVDRVPQFHVIYRRGPEIFILERTSKCARLLQRRRGSS